MTVLLQECSGVLLILLLIEDDPRGTLGLSLSLGDNSSQTAAIEWSTMLGQL